MAFKAKDGTEFGSGRVARRYDRRMASQSPAVTTQDDQNQDQPQSITDDPKAMQLVDELKSMGYTADDVAQAMGDEDQDQTPGDDSGAAATQAASIQLPGLS